MELRIALYIFCVFSLINSYLDLKTMQVSIILNYIGITICTVLFLVSSPHLFIERLLGSMVLFLVFLLVWIITHKGLGWGDIHYSIFCGLISGFPVCIFSGLAASVIGLFVFLTIKVAAKKKNVKNMKVPFIPIMFLGTIFSLCISDIIITLLQF